MGELGLVDHMRDAGVVNVIASRIFLIARCFVRPGVTMTLTGGANSGSCMKDNSATIAFKCDQSITSKTYDFTFVGSVDCVTYATLVGVSP